ncbi:hypothetical protein QYM36_014238 [Artemia franciscana]|uniref:Uncharacterized protein n=1 Tax=Artemia franciscana TaxID=6661 RepID=A0AA88HPP5_ARTSF|nr:hypothetical protein QYM36_014238 [Artemia franciscana]
MEGTGLIKLTTFVGDPLQREHSVPARYYPNSPIITYVTVTGKAGGFKAGKSAEAAPSGYPDRAFISSFSFQHLSATDDPDWTLLPVGAVCQHPKKGDGLGYWSDLIISSADNHLASIEMVSLKQAELAAVDSLALQNALDQHPAMGSEIHILDTLGPLPSHPNVVRAAMDTYLRQQIEKALLDMDKDKKWADKFAKFHVLRYESISSQMFEIDKEMRKDRLNFSPGRGRLQFSSDGERKDFIRGSERPYFHKGRGRGSGCETNGGGLSYAQNYTEFGEDSNDGKVNIFVDRGNKDGDYNRGRVFSKFQSVPIPNQYTPDILGYVINEFMLVKQKAKKEARTRKERKADEEAEDFYAEEARLRVEEHIENRIERFFPKEYGATEDDFK